MDVNQEDLHPGFIHKSIYIFGVMCAESCCHYFLFFGLVLLSCSVRDQYLCSPHCMDAVSRASLPSLHPSHHHFSAVLCLRSTKVSQEVIPLRRRNTNSLAPQELNPIKPRLVVLFSFNLYPSLKEWGGGVKGRRGRKKKAR